MNRLDRAVSETRPLLLWFLVSTTACTRPADSPAESRLQATDSMGVEIVHVSQDTWSTGEAWSVDPQPVLEIGSGGPDSELFRIRGAVRLSDGSIVIANAGSQQLRVFDGAGRFVRALGGEGEGPGEFKSLFGIGNRGDTVLAHDFLASRISWFSVDGTLLGDVTFPRDDGLPLQIHPIDDGFLAMHLESTTGVGPDATYRRREARYVEYDHAASLVQEVDRVPGPEAVMTQQPMDGGGVVATMTTPLVAHREWSAVVDDRLVVGVTDEGQLRVYDPDGRLERLIRSPRWQLPVGQTEWDAVIAEEIESRDETANARRSVESLAELVPRPERRPAFAGIVSDSEGYVWLRPYRPPEASTEAWLVVDPDGPILGEVELPADFRPVDIGVDYVLGVTRDELDVAHVRLLQLHR